MFSLNVFQSSNVNNSFKCTVPWLAVLESLFEIFFSFSPFFSYFVKMENVLCFLVLLSSILCHVAGELIECQLIDITASFDRCNFWMKAKQTEGPNSVRRTLRLTNAWIHLQSQMSSMHKFFFYCFVSVAEPGKIQRCNQRKPVENNGCHLHQTVHYYNTSHSLCLKTEWDGCGAYPNLFHGLDECIRTCCPDESSKFSRCGWSESQVKVFSVSIDRIWIPQ